MYKIQLRVRIPWLKKYNAVARLASPLIVCHEFALSFGMKSLTCTPNRHSDYPK